MRTSIAALAMDTLLLGGAAFLAPAHAGQQGCGNGTVRAGGSTAGRQARRHHWLRW